MKKNDSSTGVFIHEERFPLRILNKLVPADPRCRDPSNIHNKSVVRRLDPLFRYESRVDASGSGSEKGKEKASKYYGGNQEEESLNGSEILTFESPIEGAVCEWCVEVGALLTDPYKPILRILEPCKHPVQLGGLCAVCGKDLTSVDYTGFSETSRANIQMTHDSSALTVSLEEADRLERQTSSRLIKDKKLSLIVDLDQTIIHATVDPTVGDWMHDEKNPNYPVLRDVQRFRLLNEAGQEDGCWYYVKPRPTLQKFLQDCARMYEMHVYTMGTRQYAENVCKVIDPEGKIFSTRILSRDESGSMVHKSLQRLFPMDQSMVVVIDDRADVWDWSPNLVKVIPYEFFVGIGDINGAFLPKKKSVLPAGLNASTSPDPSSPSSVTTSSASEVSTPSDATTMAMSPSDAPNIPLAEAISEQNVVLDQQMHDKPLARMQEEKSALLHHLHEEHAKEKHKSTSTSSTPSDNHNNTAETTTNAPASKRSTTPTAPPPSIFSSGPSTSSDSTKAAVNASKGNASAKAASSTNGIGGSRFIAKASTADSDSDSDSSSGDGDSASDIDGEPKPASKTSGIAVQPEPPKDTERRQEAASQPEGVQGSVDAKEADTDMQIEEEQPDADGASQLDQEEEAVLRDDDIELDRVYRVLKEVHDRYYDHGRSDDEGVPSIIPDLKREVLRGCHIVFSSVIPLDQDPARSEIWQIAEQFGAVCAKTFSSRTTHVIAAKRGTTKVHMARRRGSVHVVTPSWLLESSNKWAREPESAHQLEPEDPETAVMASTNNSPKSFPSTPEPDPPDEIITKKDSTNDNLIDELEEDDDEGALHEIDWGDAEAEIAAALEETDDDEDGGISQDVSDTESISSVAGPTSTRKRPRSSPSSRSNSSQSVKSAASSTESPLAKRRKVAAARAGKSKLKMSESIVGEEEGQNAQASVPMQTGNTVSSTTTTTESQNSSPIAKVKDEDEDEAGTTSDDDDLDDFAKALEGELS